MQNPNTWAVTIAGAAALGVQWLVQRYAHAALSDYWKGVVTVAIQASVLYIGRDGLKAAVMRLLNGPRKVWAGAQPPAA